MTSLVGCQNLGGEGGRLSGLVLPELTTVLYATDLRLAWEWKPCKLLHCPSQNQKIFLQFPFCLPKYFAKLSRFHSQPSYQYIVYLVVRLSLTSARVYAHPGFKSDLYSINFR